MLNQDNLSFFYFGIENMHKKIRKKVTVQRLTGLKKTDGVD